MKIVIAGAGSVGSYMAEELAKLGHDIVLLDNDPAVATRGESIPGVTFMLGDSCDADVLTRAGVADADVVSAVTGDRKSTRLNSSHT